MNFKNITITKRIVLISLGLISIASFAFMVYAIVYANPESAYRKNGFIIGLLFIVLTRTTLSFYKSSIRKLRNPLV